MLLFPLNYIVCILVYLCSLRLSFVSHYPTAPRTFYSLIPHITHIEMHILTHAISCLSSYQCPTYCFPERMTCHQRCCIVSLRNTRFISYNNIILYSRNTHEYYTYRYSYSTPYLWSSTNLFLLEKLVKHIKYLYLLVLST